VRAFEKYHSFASCFPGKYTLYLVKVRYADGFYNLPNPMKIPDQFFSPVLASLIQKRHEALVLSGVVALQFGLTTAGLPGWPCPFKAAFGIPCPGCGLSTAVGLLLHGNWRAAIATHAFAPVFLLGLVFVIGVSILPKAAREAAIQKIGAIEKRTGITVILLISFMFYWGFRLLRF